MTKTQITIIKDALTFWRGDRAGRTFKVSEQRRDAILQIARAQGWVGNVEVVKENNDMGHVIHAGMAFFLAPAGQTPWSYRHLLGRIMSELHP